jgi:membrane protease YdiL (CAAX protease family)
VSFVRRHAVLTYFGLVFLLSWGGLLILDPGRFPPSARQFANLGPLVYLAIIAGPSVSGILMIAIADGMPGIRDFLARLRRWRVAPGWYVLALMPALLIAGATLLLSLISAELRPAIIAAENRSAILIGAIGPSLLVGALEEIGWTGFAVPHLRARHSILVTGLVVGVVWGAWHFPLFWEADSFYATLPLTILLTRLFAWLPPFRVLLICIHERTRSLPVVMLMHAAVSFVSIVFAHHGLSGARLLASPLVSAATMWLLVAGVSIAGRRRSEGHPLEPSTV